MPAPTEHWHPITTEEQKEETAIEKLFQIIQGLTEPASETRNQAHEIALAAMEESQKERYVITQIAKHWRGHIGVNYETTTTLNLLRLIRDALPNALGVQGVSDKPEEKTLGEKEGPTNREAS